MNAVTVRRAAASIYSRPLVWYATISIALSLGIIKGGGVPVHGDLTFPWRLENLEQLYRFLFNDFGSISNLEAVNRGLLFLPLIWIAKALGAGPGSIHALLFLGLPLISMLSCHSLLSYVASRHATRFPVGVQGGACVIYAFSPWVLENLQATLFWMAYALTPLLVLLIFRLRERASITDALALSVTLTYIGTTPHYLAFSALVILLTYTLTRGRNPAAGKRFQALTVLAVSFLGLNLCWILPTALILTQSDPITPGYELTQEMIDVFGARSNISNVLQGTDQWVSWFTHDPVIGRSSPLNRLTALSVVVPLVGLSAAIGHGRRNTHYMTLVTVSSLFVVLSLGSRTPIYSWLAFSAPGAQYFGWLFRVPGKLSYVPWTCYAIGLCLALEKLGRRLRESHTAWLGPIVLLVALAPVVPKVIRYFHHYYLPVSQPQSYVELENFLEREAGDFRVLYLAPYEWGYGQNELHFETSFSWNPNRVAAATPVISSPKPSIGYYHLTYRDWEKSLFREIYPNIPESVGETYLREVGVKYLVFHNDIVGAGERGRRDLQAIAGSDLELRKSFGNISVYENPYFEHWISAEPRIERTTRRTPTHYTFLLSTTGGTRLKVGQAHDPLWRVQIGSAEFRPHATSNGLMEFYIPEGVSGPGHLKYVPQEAYDLGLTISLSTLGGCLAIGLIARTHSRSRRPTNRH